MKIYVAGPMRGLPKDNHAAFDSVTAMLRSLGHEVISPAETARSLPVDVAVEVYVRRDLEDVIASDVIYFLPGWETSLGARAEHAVATWMDKQRWYASPSIPEIA